MRNPTPKNHSAVEGQTLGLRRRLQEVPLSLSPSNDTVNKPRGKNGRVKSWGRGARERSAYRTNQGV